MNQEPIRILHVIGIMNRGGAETMIMNYYRSIDRSKVQFDFVENSFEPAVFDEEIQSLGGRIFRCPHYNGKNHITYVRWWKQFFREHCGEFAAVHGHLGSTAAIYLSAAKKAGVYTIAHSHNTHQISLSGMVYQMYSYPTRYIADYFFGCSQDAGISRYGKRICDSSEKFSVLNNAIDTDHFAYREEIRAKIRRKLGLEGKLVIGHVGRFFAQKNHRFLLEIFAQIHKRNADAVLLLVGDGELRGEIEKQIRDSGLDECVILAGVQADVNPYYHAMDVFLFPSLYEGLGIVAVEAQTTGLPCVISDRVSTECIVAEDLVTVSSLKNNVEKWATVVLSLENYCRKSHVDMARERGYDILEATALLQKFYLKIGES
jgi:glycosyltransferase involved in cell wall biosynthesis